MLMVRAKQEKNVFNNTASGAKVRYAAHWGRGCWSAISFAGAVGNRRSFRPTDYVNRHLRELECESHLYAHSVPISTA